MQDAKEDARGAGEEVSRLQRAYQARPERQFFIYILLVRIHFFTEMIWWTGLAPWELEFPFPGSLKSTFLEWGVPRGQRSGVPRS